MAMKNIRLSLIVLLVAVMLLNCGRNELEFEPKLNVFCILRNDTGIQRVIVDRTYRMDEPAHYDLEDAQVMLSGNELCDTLVQIFDSAGIFNTRDSFPISSGKEYCLQVSAKGFDTVVGTTVIPDAFLIISPGNGDTVDYFSDTLIIKKNYFSQMFEIRVKISDSCLHYLGWCGWGDTNTTFLKIPIASIIWLEEPDTCREYNIKVTAADKNFMQYYFYPQSDSIDACGIENGIGLFGSFWSKEIEVFVRFLSPE